MFDEVIRKLHSSECEETFGEVLREFRQQRKITQERLGMMLDFAANTISRWENTSALPPDGSTPDRIAEILRCSPSEKVRLRNAYLCDTLKRIFP